VFTIEEVTTENYLIGNSRVQNEKRKSAVRNLEEVSTTKKLSESVPM